VAHRSRNRNVPDPEEILDFIRKSPAPVGKREIARAVGIGAAGRHALNRALAALEEDGRIGRAANRRYTAGNDMPSVAVLEITGIDADGEVVAALERRRGSDPADDADAPPIHVIAEHRRGTAAGVGERVLARLSPGASGVWEARIMRRLPPRPTRVLGRFITEGAGDGEGGDGGGRVQPVERGRRTEFAASAENAGGAEDGDLVMCDMIDGTTRGLPSVRVAERLGALTEPGAASLISIHEHDIPLGFSAAALEQAENSGPAPMAGRTDLRGIPLVTIDDADARDFDDAVWAEPDSDPGNAGGWHMVVAIADVAWYVRPGDALDGCARERGNSVYFPDRVVPMLPAALSNGLCSLKPGEDRPCLAVHIRIDKAGNIRRHEFVRGMMRSAARLTYRELYEAFGKRGGNIAPPVAAPLLADVPIEALFGAFGALQAARRERGAMDLDLDERRIVMAEAGTVERVELRPRYDSHRLIEEFMIAANVCAAETLEAAGLPCMYRIHEDPPADRLAALRQYLAVVGHRLAGGQAVRPRHFAQLLHIIADRPEAHTVNLAILRAQSQAIYSPEPLGHFGLALRRYAHFTSPIRRYADLMVHRALVSALNFGAGGLVGEDGSAFGALGEHLSMSERRATAAERRTTDRLIAAFLEPRLGAEFEARITGVERFGMFVALEDNGAEGLLPLSALGDEPFRLDSARFEIRGRDSGETFRPGDRMRVRLIEANALTGGLIFGIAGRAPRPAESARNTKRAPRRAARRRNRR
jgi:ribonuclease R